MKKTFLLILFISTAMKMYSQKSIYKDFSAYHDTDWISVRDPSYAGSGGNFVQRNGYIENFYPAHTDTSVMFSGDTGYAMRILKGVEACNGKVEMELLLIGKAAPSIYVRGRIVVDKHFEGYNCVIFNQNLPNSTEGINIWNYGPTRLLKWLDLPIPRHKKIKFGVEFIDDVITCYVDDVMVGKFQDPNPISKGVIGIGACEGPSYFYNFKFTSYDSLTTSPSIKKQTAL